MSERRNAVLERLIMEDFDRMMAVKTRGEKFEAFYAMADHIEQRSKQQVNKMERTRGLGRSLRDRIFPRHWRA